MPKYQIYIFSTTSVLTFVLGLWHLINLVWQTVYTQLHFLRYPYPPPCWFTNINDLHPAVWFPPISDHFHAEQG